MLQKIARWMERGAALLFNSGPAHGEVIGSQFGDPLYHASLDPHEYRELFRLFGLTEVAYAPEDPATGSAAGPLAVHVCRHGLAVWGEWIEISQGVEIDRPSTLYALAERRGGGELSRVAVGGRAVVVARGEFRL